jgi:hypothetical protein
MDQGSRRSADDFDFIQSRMITMIPLIKGIDIIAYIKVRGTPQGDARHFSSSLVFPYTTTSAGERGIDITKASEEQIRELIDTDWTNE